jgi:hypothetical protein
MPIPTLNENGLLPEGIFDCTLAEIRMHFGKFQQTDQRPRLFLRLEELFETMQRSELFEFFARVRELPNLRKGLLRLNL